MIYLNLPEVSGTDKEIGQNMGCELSPMKISQRPVMTGTDHEIGQNSDRKCEPVRIGLNEYGQTTATDAKRAVCMTVQ